jgi:aspartate carbamoyltransferase catalytic subunit
MTSAYLDQPTSRSRLSFESAILHLGGSLMDFGERLEHLEGSRGLLCEVVEMCSTLGDVAVLRTREADTLASVLGAFRVPVINAGNGVGENPSHSLADLYTLLKWRPDLLDDEPQQPIQVGIIGSPANMRTIRGILQALAQFPAGIERVIIFSRQATIFSPGQREELEAAGLNIVIDRELYPHNSLQASAKAELPAMDLLYVHSRGESSLSRQGRIESYKMLKEGALVLHPETQADESVANLDDSPHNGYFTQARGGVFIRIAILASLFGVAPQLDDEELDELVEQDTGVAEDGG